VNRRTDANLQSNRKTGLLRRIRQLAGISLVATVFFLSSCATTVSESSRNQDGTFDGTWRAQVAKPPAEYRTQNWRITCWKTEISFPFTISNGQVAIRTGNSTGRGFINDDGKFRVIIPRQKALKNKVSNKGSLLRGRNIIVEGQLDKKSGTGRYTSGLEDLGNQGCNAKTKFTRT